MAPNLCWKAYTFVEFFAGKAACSQAVRSAGYATASLDINYGIPPPRKQNVMDILTASGMASLSDIKLRLHRVFGYNVAPHPQPLKQIGSPG